MHVRLCLSFMDEKSEPNPKPKIKQCELEKKNPGKNCFIQNKNINPAQNKEKIVALICATWNVKRGLVKRELEISHQLKAENVDIIFLTETDHM